MFGARIRNWMETHFVRHRKKRSKEAKVKDPPASEPSKSQPSPVSNISHTEPGRSSGPQTQSTSALCHSNPATSSSNQPTKRVTLVSPTLSCKFTYTEESTGSPRRPTLHAAINNNNNKLGARYSSYLSSPESAYSTGYSTDATSPYEPSIDTSLSPEYYINIRTGTRYFQSVDNDLQSKHDNLRSSFLSGHASRRSEFATKREDCKKTGGLRSFSSTPPPPPPRKSSIPESALTQNETVRASPNLDQISHIQQKQQFCNSPRQRCRIRTNPWLSSSTASETIVCVGKEKNNSGEAPEATVPLTPLNEDISTAATIGSWHVADSTTTCDEESCDEDEEVYLREKPQRRKQVAANKKRSTTTAALKKRGSFSSDSTLLSTPSISRCSSVEDATLNELGRFDESYTYDKETDILSDSDVTDCEVDDTTITTTTSATVTKTFNEPSSCTSHTVCEMELDYIDVGEHCDTQTFHEGHCSYHLSYNHSEFKHLSSSAASSKNKRSSQKRNQNRVTSPALRSNGVDSPALRHRKVESPILKAVESPALKLRGMQSPSLRSKRVESPALKAMNRTESPLLRLKAVDSPVLRNKFLPEKKIESGGSNCSTPLVRRRTPVGSNCSTPKISRSEAFMNNKSTSSNSTPVRKAPADLPLKKSTDSKKSSTLSKKYSESELKLIEADKEADRKYRQLIKEAESLLVHMRNVAVEEVDLETPTVEEPIKLFPQPPPPQPRPDPARLQIKFQKPSAPAYPAVTVTTPSGGPPRALVTFRSVDLNSPVASEAPYCPQSEPVKRKVYSSAALQRLQDHFKLTELDESSDSSPPEADESSSADTKSPPLTEDYGSQEERRKRRQEARTQYKLAVARKNNVVNILEELKLNLQTQSARLHDEYRSTTDLRSPCVGDVTPSPLKANITFGSLNIFSPIRRTSLSVKSPKHN